MTHNKGTLTLEDLHSLQMKRLNVCLKYQGFVESADLLGQYLVSLVLCVYNVREPLKQLTGQTS